MLSVVLQSTAVEKLRFCYLFTEISLLQVGLLADHDNSLSMSCCVCVCVIDDVVVTEHVSRWNWFLIKELPHRIAADVGLDLSTAGAGA